MLLKLLLWGAASCHLPLHFDLAQFFPFIPVLPLANPPLAELRVSIWGSIADSFRIFLVPEQARGHHLVHVAKFVVFQLLLSAQLSLRSRSPATRQSHDMSTIFTTQKQWRKQWEGEG